METRLLIVGCRGQVGSCLCVQAEGLGWRVAAVDRNELDITDPEAVLKLVTEWQPRVIINAAAHTAVDKAETDREASYAVNRDGPAYLAAAAVRVGAILLHISTDYVFAGDQDGLYSESDPVAPQGVYGASKLAGEVAVSAACPQHLILRTAWVFGEQGNNFVKTMLRLGAQREEMGVVADQFGGPTYAADIAAALLEMARQALVPGFKGWGLYHFSGEPHVSWFEFAQAIFAQAAHQGVLPKVPHVRPITTADYPTPARRPANSRLDCRKIQHVFGIQPSHWQQALLQIQAYV